MIKEESDKIMAEGWQLHRRTLYQSIIIISNDIAEEGGGMINYQSVFIIIIYPI